MTLSSSTWRSIVLCIAAAALLLRMTALDLKPFHHDEGVNAFFLANLVRPPHVYRYDPTNYHGPTLYYFAWVSAAAYGLTDFALRFVPAVFGLLTIALVLALRRSLGDIGTTTAAVALTLSPGAVFHSRYFIHESLLVCSTLALVVACQRYVSPPSPQPSPPSGGRGGQGETGPGGEGAAASGGRGSWRWPWLVLAALAAAGMTATKETWIIAAGVLACASVATVVWCRWRGRVMLQPPQRPALGAALVVTAVFVTVNLLFYTSLFTNWAGAVDALRALNVWAQTGQAHHAHPWHTYLAWLGEHDLPILVVGLCGAGVALWRGNDPFAVFAGLWGLGIIAAYSLIPYKTPWLTLNMLPPLALSAGWLIETLARIATPTWRRIGLLALALLCAGVTFQTVTLNFFRYDDERHGYVYVQTSREIRALVDRIASLIGRTDQRVPVTVMSPDQFPLSWYLRDVAAGYPGRVEPATRGIVVASLTQSEEAASVLGDRFIHQGEYTLRPGVVLVLYASRDLVALE